MIILGIETSCDETGAAVLEQDQNGIHILSSIVASSAELQAKYGGVIPEQAAREQIKSIIPVIQETLLASGHRPQDLDAIAVTYGPGLIGSLLVGVETAKTLATIWNKPLIPINHLLGHFYGNWIGNNPKFPCLGLLISGGHTDLVLFTGHNQYTYLGGTRDDACGECFDKCARLLGLPYPGGPQISKLAETGDPAKFDLPVPMKDNKSLDFSYSGLKTAVARMATSQQLTASSRADLASAIEATIIKSLIDKVVLAIQKNKVEQIMIAGGVAANKKLKAELQSLCSNFGIILHVPEPDLCTDNGAMIAAAGLFTRPASSPLSVEANPNLTLA